LVSNSLFAICFDLFPIILIVISITRGIFKKSKETTKLLLHKSSDVNSYETNNHKEEEENE
jgi:hypothetical protein